MGEAGVDLSGTLPAKLTLELAASASIMMTMGCGDQCPMIPGVERGDWPISDPKSQPIEAVRVIRDEIRQRVQALLEQHHWARSPLREVNQARSIQAGSQG